MEIRSDELHAALVDALLKGMTSEVREKVLADAMRAYLFEPKKDVYGGKTTTPLSEAFQKALDSAARQASIAFLEEPEQKNLIRTKIEESLREAMIRLDFTKTIVERLTNALNYR
jgi:hypothetical protein